MKKLSAFARNVRGLRQEFGLSTEKFSEIMEISVSTLGNWERGNAIPHVSHIEDLVNFSFDNDKKYGYVPYVPRFAVAACPYKYS